MVSILVQQVTAILVGFQGDLLDNTTHTGMAEAIIESQVVKTKQKQLQILAPELSRMY